MTRGEALTAAVVLRTRGSVALGGDRNPSCDTGASFAAVMSRDIVGDRGGRATVQSPIKKQAFALDDGICLDDPTVAVPVYETRVTADGHVEVCS